MLPFPSAVIRVEQPDRDWRRFSRARRGTRPFPGGGRWRSFWSADSWYHVRLSLPRGRGSAAVLSASEFTETRLVPATPEGLRVMWEALGADMTVNAAGALAAWEDAGAGRRRVQGPDRPPGGVPARRVGGGRPEGLG